MRYFPMDAPAELHRRVSSGEGGDVTVARGPLLIMAHGLMAIAPEHRDKFWITGPMGDLSPQQIEATLRAWQRGPRG